MRDIAQNPHTNAALCVYVDLCDWVCIECVEMCECVGRRFKCDEICLCLVQWMGCVCSVSVKVNGKGKIKLFMFGWL